MKRELVYNANGGIYFGTLYNAAKRCILSGFSFLLFNGIIYFINHNGNFSDTKLRESDLIA